MKKTKEYINFWLNSYNDCELMRHLRGDKSMNVIVHNFILSKFKILKNEKFVGPLNCLNSTNKDLFS